MQGKPKKLTGFRALCYHYLYLLGKLKKPTAPPRRSRYMMDEIIKFDRYQEQFKFLVKYKIDTPAQLTLLTEAIQGEIDALTDQRKELYCQKRKGPENQMLSASIQSINRSIRTKRHELRLCAHIEADIPKVKENLKTQPSKRREPKTPERRPSCRRERPHLR